MAAPSMMRRLIVWLTGTLSAFWLIAAGLGVIVMEDEFSEIFDSSLQETAQRLLPLVVDDLAQRNGVSSSQHLEDPALAEEEEYLTYQVRDRSGRVLLQSRDAPLESFDVPLAAGFWENETYRFYTASDSTNSIFVQVADAMANRQEAVVEGGVALLLPLAILIPLGGALIWLVVRHALRPVGELRAAIEEKDGGNMAAIEIDGLPAELQSIARSVNTLLARLRDAFDAEREFTANSAHELRTPIAGALAQTQLLVSMLREEPEKRRAEQVEASLVKLGHLAEKLLQLARADAGIGTNEALADLGVVLDLVVEEFGRQASVDGRLRYTRLLGAAIVGPYNEDAFAIVLRNLIENALRHGKPDMPIDIRFENGSVRILNAAEPLSAVELAAIRQRFGRGRTRAAGTGLGLSIVDRLLAQMNAELLLFSPVEGTESGFEARIDFHT